MPLCSQCPVPDLYKVPNIFLVHERMDDEIKEWINEQNMEWLVHELDLDGYVSYNKYRHKILHLLSLKVDSISSAL